MTEVFVTETMTSKWGKCVTTVFLSWGKQQQPSVLARKSADLRSVFLSQEKAQAAAPQKGTRFEAENPTQKKKALQKGACCSAQLVRTGLRCITAAYQKWHLVIFNENNHLSVTHRVL